MAKKKPVEPVETVESGPALIATVSPAFQIARTVLLLPEGKKDLSDEE